MVAEAEGKAGMKSRRRRLTLDSKVGSPKHADTSGKGKARTRSTGRQRSGSEKTNRIITATPDTRNKDKLAQRHRRTQTKDIQGRQEGRCQDKT